VLRFDAGRTVREIVRVSALIPICPIETPGDDGKC
jgi:hypothetical protein